MVLTLFSVCFIEGPNYFIPQQYNHAIFPQGGKRDTFPGLINSNKHEMPLTNWCCTHSCRYKVFLFQQQECIQVGCLPIIIIIIIIIIIYFLWYINVVVFCSSFSIFFTANAVTDLYERWTWSGTLCSSG